MKLGERKFSMLRKIVWERVNWVMANSIQKIIRNIPSQQEPQQEPQQFPILSWMEQQSKHLSIGMGQLKKSQLERTAEVWLKSPWRRCHHRTFRVNAAAQRSTSGVDRGLSSQTRGAWESKRFVSKFEPQSHTFSLFFFENKWHDGGWPATPPNSVTSQTSGWRGKRKTDWE